MADSLLAQRRRYSAVASRVDGKRLAPLLRAVWIKAEIAFVSLYIAAIPLPNFTALPEGVREWLYNRRPYALVMFIALVVLGRAVFDFSALVRLVQARWWRIFASVSALFPAYYAVLSLRKAEPSWASVGLYASWATFTAVVAPLMLGVEKGRLGWPRRFALLNSIIFAGSATAVLVGVAEATRFGGRLTLGFENPNYFAQISQVAAVAFALHTAERRRSPMNQVGQVFLLVAAIGVAVLAESRNVLFSLVTVVVLTYLVAPLVSRRPWLAFMSAALIIGVLVPGASFLPWADVDLDNFSSGRISLWEATVTAIMTDGSPAVAFFFGPEHLPQLGMVNVYDPMAEAKAFRKYHVDNTYLEYFVEGGAVGLVLALLPWALSFGAAVRGSVGRFTGGASRVAGSIIAGVAVQACFVAVSPTFNSPLGFFLAFLIVVPMQAGEQLGGAMAKGGKCVEGYVK